MRHASFALPAIAFLSEAPLRHIEVPYVVEIYGKASLGAMAATVQGLAMVSTSASWLNDVAYAE